MSNNRFIKTRSNYTIKKKSQTTDQGVIYERDYMTIKNGGGETNFKFVTNHSPLYQKKYSAFETDYTGQTYITNDYGSKNIQLKPTYRYLSDFAFYGSAVSLVEHSVKNIILSFPAEIVLYEDGTVENDYDIEMFSRHAFDETLYNKSRDLAGNWNDFDIIDENGEKHEILSYDVNFENQNPNRNIHCVDNSGIYTVLIIFDSGSIAVKKYFDFQNEKWVYIQEGRKKYKIRPKEHYLKEFREKLSDFEKVLLNDDSNPLYTCYFLTPRENEYGLEYVKKSYTWPAFEGYNPDINSLVFQDYISELYDLAVFYDENFSNNIYETMVHDSIKNMDYSFIINNDNDVETVEIDNSRLKTIIEIWGQQYDFIKRYIDTIGNSNNISYDGRGNIPDYFLSRKNSLRGWEIRQVVSGFDPSVETDSLHPYTLKGRNAKEANTSFLSSLKLNSEYIFGKKGTVEGIYALLSLFGFGKEDVSVREYVSIARGRNGEYPTAYEYAHSNFLIEGCDESPSIIGLAVQEVKEGDGQTKRYMIPWYDKKEEYDNSFYFQSFGGWDRKHEKIVKNGFTGNNVLLKGDEIFNMYGETTPLIKVISDVKHMVYGYKGSLNKNEVLYVRDILGLDETYKTENPGEKINIDRFSHYFILENPDSSYTFGYDALSNSYGWRNVFIEEFDDDNLSLNAKRVLYTESLKEETQGNNPHLGNYSYDYGRSYLDSYKSIFDKRDLSRLDDAEKEEILNIGYDVEDPIIDPKKIWFFEDMLRERDNSLIISKINENLPDNDPWKSKENLVKDVEALNPFNPEHGEKYDEAAANSILNTKYLSIIFRAPSFKNDTTVEGIQKKREFLTDMKAYIENIVMFYVKQIVPSTTILNVVFVSREDVGYDGHCLSDNCEKPAFRPQIDGVGQIKNYAKPYDKSPDSEGLEPATPLNITEGKEL